MGIKRNNSQSEQESSSVSLRRHEAAIDYTKELVEEIFSANTPANTNTPANNTPANNAPANAGTPANNDPANGPADTPKAPPNNERLRLHVPTQD